MDLSDRWQTSVWLSIAKLDQYKWAQLTTNQISVAKFCLITLASSVYPQFSSISLWMMQSPVISHSPYGMIFPPVLPYAHSWWENSWCSINIILPQACSLFPFISLPCNICPGSQLSSILACSSHHLQLIVVSSTDIFQSLWLEQTWTMQSTNYHRILSVCHLLLLLIHQTK